LRRQPLALVDRPAFVVQKRRRDMRLLAPEHLESAWQCRREVLARKARVHRDVSELAFGPVGQDREADVADQAALLGDQCARALR
jgi:hypothetical protein